MIHLWGFEKKKPETIAEKQYQEALNQANNEIAVLRDKLSKNEQQRAWERANNAHKGEEILRLKHDVTCLNRALARANKRVKAQMEALSRFKSMKIKSCTLGDKFVGRITEAEACELINNFLTGVFRARPMKTEGL